MAVTEISNIHFDDYNNKFSSIKKTLTDEYSKFISDAGKNSNVEIIPQESNVETWYRFKHPDLVNLSIKTCQENCGNDFEKEYRILKLIPQDKIGGQEAVARIFRSRAYTSGEYFLVSTIPSGTSASEVNKFDTVHLANLFNNMFELDKLGIYHGELSNPNILLNVDGNVSFCNYRWAQTINKINFFDAKKENKCFLPKSLFLENAQSFEMFSIPQYFDYLKTPEQKENFVKLYLKAKSKYHQDRYEFIKKLTKRWPYKSELETIRMCLDGERAKADVYKNPDEDIIRLELKKFQFLSDYRDAYNHVDPGNMNRNILNSSSSYLCSISSVQDFRKEVVTQLSKTTDEVKKNYLRSMDTYGRFWYNNLINYSSGTFDYVIRMASAKPNWGEELFDFYRAERNPLKYKPNRDLTGNMSSVYHTVYDAGLDIPEDFHNKLKGTHGDLWGLLVRINHADRYNMPGLGWYEVPILPYSKSCDLVSDARKSVKAGTVFETLNSLQSAITYSSSKLIEEYNAYPYFDYVMDRINSFRYMVYDHTQSLFHTILNGLKSDDAEKIVVKGYKNMRNFKCMI